MRMKRLGRRRETDVWRPACGGQRRKAEAGVGRPVCGGGMWSSERRGGLKNGCCDESKMCGLWVLGRVFNFCFYS